MHTLHQQSKGYCVHQCMNIMHIMFHVLENLLFLSKRGFQTLDTFFKLRQIILLPLSFSFHVIYFSTDMIFPFPLHNLIFLNSILNKLPRGDKELPTPLVPADLTLYLGSSNSTKAKGGPRLFLRSIKEIVPYL